jgi:UDPglucose 6-dehydrogenase
MLMQLLFLTEWDEFVDNDWKKIYDNMMKPAFVFDGRNILDGAKLEEIRLKYYGTGR